MGIDGKPQNVTFDASLSEVRQRAAWFARSQFPQHAEKALQRELDVSETTAERILAGDVSRPVLDRMLARWGWRFAQFALAPLCGPVDGAGLERRIASAEEQVRQALKEIDEVRREAALGAVPALDRRAPDQAGLVVRAPGEGDPAAVLTSAGRR